MSGVSPARGGRPAALLVSASLLGHRVIYCRVLAGILVRLGYDVVVAGDLSDPEVAARPLVVDLGRRPHVTLHDAGASLEGPDAAAGLRAMAAEVLPALTLLTEADGLAAAMRAASGRLVPGRLIALFIRATNYQYRRPPGVLARLRRVAGDGSRTGQEGFHERFLPGRRPVDAALVLDERFAASHPATHAWLPDIYREHEPLDAAAAAETELWRDRLREMRAQALRRPVVVYVGTNQHRRGYDTLLRLAVDEDAHFLHCGRLGADDPAADARAAELRAVLARRGALLETGGGYLHPDTATEFLQAARCVVLPYRQHDGSSGVQLQSVAAGLPVVVPDRGLMAWRTRSFGLGRVYADGDEGDLRRAFHELQAAGPRPYAARLAAFASCFAEDQVAAAVRAAVTGEGPAAALPQDVFAGAIAEPVS